MLERLGRVEGLKKGTLSINSISAFNFQTTHRNRSRQYNIKTSTLHTMSAADDQYEIQDEIPSGNVPSGEPTDNDYASRSGQYQIPVQKDETPVSDPIDPATADSDEMLGMVTSTSRNISNSQ